MFFKNHLISVAAKFLWFGLIFGLFFVLCKFVVKVSKRNVYVSNIVWFCFFLPFGGVFAWLCNLYYSSKFCWYGLFLMIFGLILVQISLDFFFTKFAKMVYNIFVKLKRESRHERFQAKKEG